MHPIRPRDLVLLGLCLSACHGSAASPNLDPVRTGADAAGTEVATPVDAADAAPVKTPCSAGQHLCAGTCVANDDVRTCGTSCEPCPVPSGGIATCDGNQCEVECQSVFRFCLGQCIGPEDNCSETCGFTRTAPLTCGKICLPDTPNSCCSHAELCGAYGCRDNQCIHVCKANADCASGQTCDVTTGKCGPCGGKGQFCCWDQADERYTCDGFEVYCMGMRCVPVPGK
jgi:hypothetical protein